MLILTEIVQRLRSPDATVGSLASLGSLGKRSGGEYLLQPADDALGDVRLGVPAEDRGPQTGIRYVKLYLPQTSGYHLRDIQPSCSLWKKIPGNPGASPFLYACPLPAQPGQVQVNLIATLSGAENDASSHLMVLTLQRGA